MEDDSNIMSPRCRLVPCVLASAIRLPLALLTIAIWSHPADGRVARTECAGFDRDTSAKSAFRNETIFYGGRSQIISGNFWMFLGGVGSLGTQHIGEKLDYIEQLKFQTGLEYRIMDRSRDWDAANQMNQRQGAGRLKGSFRTLANWDIDHLVWDFPYRKRGLRPWDGGLLQFSLYN